MLSGRRSNLEEGRTPAARLPRPSFVGPRNDICDELQLRDTRFKEWISTLYGSSILF